MNTSGKRPGGIVARGLRKHFGPREVVRGLDLDVARGEIVGLLGASGCGKTTTLRMLAGLESPSGGTLHIGDRPAFAPGVFVPPEERGVGMVFQQFALFEHLDVAANIAFGLNQRTPAQRAARVDALVELTHLSTLRRARVQTLSGGEQQRCALARALAPEPAALLLDEPFANLDAMLKESVMDEVSRIVRAEDVACVLVTHDTQEALNVCDRIYVLDSGVCLQHGTPDTLYSAPAHAKVATLAGPGTFLPASAHGDGFTCALGLLVDDDDPLAVPASTEPLPAARYSVFVRPEAVAEVDAGAAFTVRKRRLSWGQTVVTAERGGHTVDYVAERSVAVDSTVHLGIVGPAHLFAGDVRLRTLTAA